MGLTCAVLLLLLFLLLPFHCAPLSSSAGGGGLDRPALRDPRAGVAPAPLQRQRRGDEGGAEAHAAAAGHHRGAEAAGAGRGRAADGQPLLQFASGLVKMYQLKLPLLFESSTVAL